MGIFLLFIPLAFFIAIEGVILYFLISMIISALLLNNFSTDAIVGNSYSAGTAIIYVVILTAAVGLAIYLYIRLAVWPAVLKNRRKKAAAVKSGAPISEPALFAGGMQPAAGGTGAAASVNAGGAYAGNPGLRVTGIAQPVKKKSKAPLVIIIAALVLILGAAAYLFVARPAWLPFELPALPFLG